MDGKLNGMTGVYEKGVACRKEYFYKKGLFAKWKRKRKRKRDIQCWDISGLFKVSFI
jgi:hypothetical protein